MTQNIFNSTSVGNLMDEKKDFNYAYVYTYTIKNNKLNKQSDNYNKKKQQNELSKLIDHNQTRYFQNFLSKVRVTLHLNRENTFRKKAIIETLPKLDNIRNSTTPNSFKGNLVASKIKVNGNSNSPIHSSNRNFNSHSKSSKRFLIYDSLNKSRTDFNSDSLNSFGLKNEQIKLEPYFPRLEKKDVQFDKDVRSYYERIMNMEPPRTPPGTPQLS